MIAYKGREVKRTNTRKSQMARNLERLYKEGKCRDCSVMVTRMDFAKILGKFTKVKIQYENVSSPKTKKAIPQLESPSTHKDSRVKTNENGMVLARRNAYNKHPINVNNTQISKKPKVSEMSTPRTVRNVLKENNGLHKTTVEIDKNCNYNRKSVDTKQYKIIFIDPKDKINNSDGPKKLLLAELIPKINESILPSEDWIIDCLPKTEQIKNDKVYDRIEAELEDLMFSEKPEEKTVQPKPEENKVDEFPSIMDILNDNYSAPDSKQNDQNVIVDFKSNIESSDVEAMLLGKSSDVKISESTPMEVDSAVMSKLIEDVENINAVASVDKTVDKSEQIVELSIKENPQSPSILDETLQKGIEEHIPAVSIQEPNNASIKEEDGNKGNDSNIIVNNRNKTEIDVNSCNSSTKVSGDTNSSIFHDMNADNVTHVIFKKMTEGKCIKTVSCPKNLKYKIELEGKSVEFLGAPKYISSIEDLQVLLQIVNESELDSLYVLH